MKTISSKANQTVWDIAVEQYGTCEAVGQILRLNPEMTNDPAALTALGIDSVNNTDFYLDVSLETGQTLTVDDKSPLISQRVIRELEYDITTFDL